MADFQKEASLSSAGDTFGQQTCTPCPMGHECAVTSSNVSMQNDALTVPSSRVHTRATSRSRQFFWVKEGGKKEEPSRTEKEKVDALKGVRAHQSVQSVPKSQLLYSAPAPP
eukprot:1228946-Pleurochrysis_carterae.AAC.1